MDQYMYLNLKMLKVLLTNFVPTDAIFKLPD